MAGMVTCEPGEGFLGVVGSNSVLELTEGSLGDGAWIELLDLEPQAASEVIVVSKGHGAITTKGRVHVPEHEGQLVLIKLSALRRLVIGGRNELFTLRWLLEEHGGQSWFHPTSHGSLWQP